MTQPFRLGFLTHIEGAGDPRQVYRDTVELFVAADALGFDTGWVAQHHFKQEAGHLPSPLPFLAAVAERTRRIRLGTAIVVLPFEHPIRLAEDAAVVDTLSGGRLELGIGSGGDPGEFEAFGLDLGARRERTSEGLAQLQQALRGETLGTSTQRLRPAAPGLAGRLWQSVYSAVGAHYAANHAVGVLINRGTYERDEPADQVQRLWAEAYLDAWDHANGAPRIGLSRGVYVAHDRAQALDGLRESIGRTAEMLVRNGTFPAGLSLEHYCKRMNVIYGSAAEVAEGLAADQVLPYTTDLILQFSPAVLPLRDAIAMLEGLATRVAPALGWKPRAEVSQDRLVAQATNDGSAA